MSASVSGAYASAHLPECTLPKGWGDCICGELRACEVRVREEYVPESGRGWGEYLAYKTGIDNGFTAGVQAARDAVAALTDERGVYILREEALAAIDALRGDA